jgi:hypothetical protein
MSAYGKLWEELRAIREQLGKLVPAADLNSLEGAERSTTAVAKEVRALMARWAAIKIEMEKIDEDD